MIRIYRSSSYIAIGAVLSLTVGAASGATLNMSSVPLFTSTSVEPNVFFVLDDSLSMETDILTSDYSNASLMNIGGVNYHQQQAMDGAYVYGTWLPLPSQAAVSSYNSGMMMMTDQLVSDADGVWRARCKDYNKLYYDPDVYYQPWVGVDRNGVAYTYADPQAANLNPYEGSTGTQWNLKAWVLNYDTAMLNQSGSAVIVSTTNYYMARYYEWTDTNSNGVVDASDSHSLIEISPTGYCNTGATCPASFTRAATRTDCSVSGSTATCTVDQELQNFATWWVYHRSRDRVVKYALSQVINDSVDVRMGMSTIHNNSSRMEVADMNTAANKSNLMSKVFSYKGLSPGTPLKAGLERAGNYYACNSSAETTTDTHYTYYKDSAAADSVTIAGNLFGNTNCPILTAANGGACQQNYTVLLTDGYDTAHAALQTWSGYPGSPTDTDWNGVVSGHANNARLYNDPFTISATNNADANTASAFDGGAYADAYSDTLADVAMYFYKTDLSSTLSNSVPTQIDVDENSAQHMVTYTVALGLEGTVSAMPTDPTAAFTWPDPSAGNQQKLDDLRHAAYNGRGDYSSATKPEDLIASLENTVNSISSRSGASAAVAFNTTTLSTNTDVYLALFNSTRWNGDLVAYPLDPNSGVISSTASWNAATQLDAMTYTSRKIFTYDGSAGLAFDTYANLTATQQADLSTDSSGTADSLGSSRFDYIRGDRSNESTGNYFRKRSSALGDIVHAGPVYVGQPNLGWDDTAPFPTTNTYSSFSTITRDAVVYVGANDGMLHAFNATTGNEEFAYIPNMLFSNSVSQGLHYLTETGYAHRYYVDMTPSIADVYVGSAWKTVLVGAMRSGARGLFALDVTHPETFSATDVMGEFTSSIDANLGYTFSRPQILMTNAVNTAGTDKRWAIIFGNGVNSGGNGRPALFLIFLDADLSNGWQMGTATTDDYLRIDVPVDTTYGDTTNPNGLFTPAVVDILDSSNGVGSNGTADRVYAGDLFGNMWGFDLSDTNPANWGVLHATTGAGAGPAPLFVSGQPITSAPVIARKTSGANDLVVMFGTGRYISSSDPSDTSTMGFYGIYDDTSKANLTTSNLTAQTLSLSSGYRTVTDNAVANNKYGWYIVLSGGERVVTDPVARGDIVYFNTTIPSTAACSTGGSGWLMSVDYINGGTPSSAVFDTNGDNVVDTSDLLSGSAPVGKSFDQGIPSSSTLLGDRRYTPGTQTSNGADVTDDQIQSLDSGNTGRLSWEHLKAPF